MMSEGNHCKLLNDARPDSQKRSCANPFGNEQMFVKKLLVEVDHTMC